MPALAFEIEHGIDQVLHHARPGDLAILGDVADQDHRGVATLGIADEVLRDGTHLRHRAGRALHRVRPQRLDRVDDADRGVRGIERRQDVLEARLHRELDRRIGEPETPGAQTDLRRGLFARDIDDLPARTRQSRERLKQNGRFADAGIPADEDRGPSDEAAAEHAVQFADAGQQARGLRLIGLERDEFELAALAGGFRWRTAGGRQRLLDDSVPAAATVAAPCPFGMDRAALLADEAGAAARHDQPNRPAMPSTMTRVKRGPRQVMIS